MSPFDRSSAPPAHPSATSLRRNRPASLCCAGIDPQASSVQVWHFLGQKLRLGGDALGADPTYLLYLPYRSRGELRRTDFEPDGAGATLSNFAAPESAHKPLLHTRGISRARSFDLEVTPWAPTRLTSCIFHLGPEESSGASTLSQAAQARP